MQNTNTKVQMTDEIKSQVAKLEAIKNNHAFWDNDLFKACEKGIVSYEDWQYIFSQYYLYNKNFTRYLTAVMTNCENDYYRACLSENLWEEGGGAEPEERHAEMFRQFLTKTLKLDLPNIEYQDFSKLFTHLYLDKCLNSSAMYGSAFLSLGTEGIVARMYTKLVEGMKHAGFADEDLKFFYLHMECDDEHAETLAEMMASYHDYPGWFGLCERAMDEALTLRKNFFNNLFETLWLTRVKPVATDITGQASLAAAAGNYKGEKSGLYNNKDEAKNIEFEVTRINVPSQVLDPRINRIKAGKNTENHSHAHETVIHFLQGEGRVTVDGKEVLMAAGETVFVPRWCNHQTFNTGKDDLVFLAVTDYKFTTRFPGNSEHSYRANKGGAERSKQMQEGCQKAADKKEFAA